MSRSIVWTALVALSSICAASVAQAGPNHPGHPGGGLPHALSCRPTVQVKMTPTHSIDDGFWTPGDAPFNVTLDPKNPPRVEGGKLICYYAMGNSPAAFVMWHVQDKYLTCTATKTGFMCAGKN